MNKWIIIVLKFSADLSLNDMKVLTLYGEIDFESRARNQISNCFKLQCIWLNGSCELKIN